jgi:trans-2,3-dihydro-3-hydroxyanthranilate isomerase
MAVYPFVTLDVFTDQRFGGNPLAVFPDAAGLDAETMQALAREFNLSETTFVLPPDDPDHTARVRIFTPQAELAFAGHPNVGTAWVLAGLGRDRDGVLRFEEGAGLVEVAVERRDRQVAGCRVAAPQPLSLADAPAPDDLAACAGLAPGDISAAIVASVGTAAVLAAVPPGALERAAPDVAAFRAAAARWPGYAGHFLLYLYARDANAVRARSFAPLYGISEDPATGSAGAALAASLLHRDGGDTLALDIRQGVEMGRPSRMQAGAERDADGGIRAWVGGRCVPVLRGNAEV